MYIYLSKWPTLVEHLVCFHILPILSTIMIQNTLYTLFSQYQVLRLRQLVHPLAATGSYHLTWPLPYEDQEETIRTVGSKVTAHSPTKWMPCSLAIFLSEIIFGSESIGREIEGESKLRWRNLKMESITYV